MDICFRCSGRKERRDFWSSFNVRRRGRLRSTIIKGFKILHSQMASCCMAETNLIALAMQEFAPHVGPELMHQVQAGVAQ